MKVSILQEKYLRFPPAQVTGSKNRSVFGGLHLLMKRMRRREAEKKIFIHSERKNDWF